MLSGLSVEQLFAAESATSGNSIEQRIQELTPKLEDYVATGMKAFDVPGVAIGILAGDKLVYSKGFGVRSKSGPPVDTETIFKIGSTAKAFLATTIAIAVDRGKLHWDDRVVAKAEGVSDWNVVLREQLFDPLGMKQSSYTAEAIKAAPNHAEGYRYAPDGSVEVPFVHVPYNVGGAGDINSNIEDMAHWVRLHLANGSFEGQPLVSPENLAVTRTPKVAINDKTAYALGWILSQTPNGNLVWHNGGTYGFGSYVGLEFDKHIGVIVLTNQSNVGFPDAIGTWTLINFWAIPPVDHVAEALKRATKEYSDNDEMFAKPANILI